MKRRILTISLIVASLVLLVSVGFAAWTIKEAHSEQVTGQNFTAYGIVSEEGTLSVTRTKVDGTTADTDRITFGHPGSHTGLTWLDYTDDDMNQENLITYIKVEWAGTQPVDFTWEHSFSSVVNAGLISGPTVSVQGSPTNANIDGTDEHLIHFTAATGSILLKVEYKFGTFFNEKNPFSFFNGKTINGVISETFTYTDVNNALSLTGGDALSASSTYKDLANKVIPALNTLCSTLTFTFRVYNTIS